MTKLSIEPAKTAPKLNAYLIYFIIELKSVCCNNFGLAEFLPAIYFDFLEKYGDFVRFVPFCIT